MAKTDRVQEIVTAAVIEALGGEANGLAAELTAEVLNKKVPKEPYSYRHMLYGMYSGGEGEQIPYLESLARTQVEGIAADAVKDWFKLRRKDLKQQIIDSIDANAIAENYLSEVENAIKDRYSLSVTVTPIASSDDD